MKYFARILKTGRPSFMICMESLSFYVEKAAEKAGLRITDGFEEINGNVAVFREDMPLIKASTIKKLLVAHEGSKSDATMGTNGEFFIVKAEAYNEMVSSLSDKESFDEFAKSFRIKFTAANIFYGGKKKEKLIVDSCKKLEKAAKIIKKRINRKHMKAGVVFADSLASYIGPRVEIGEGSVILPGTCLEGETVIGRECVIGPNTRLVNMEIGSKTTVSNTTAIDSKIGEETEVGPYAYIRPSSLIGDHVKIGDFVEVKNAVVGNYSKAAHLSYIGDADLGEHINIGCGTITVNYDGSRKSRTVIEDGAFIGSNSNLIAPVTVKRGAFVAAGSTITEEVPEDSLSIARARQVNKTDWKKK